MLADLWRVALKEVQYLGWGRIFLHLAHLEPMQRQQELQVEVVLV
jgi:hypothetical protein